MLYLQFIGFDPVSIGLLLSLAYVGSIAANVFVSLYADRIGRRRTLLSFAIVQFILCMLLLLSTSFLIVAASFLVGCLSVTGSGSDQFQAIEQATLPQASDRAKRNYLFSIYNVSNSLLMAAGTLSVSLLGTFEFVLHSSIDGYRVFFLIYALLGVLLVALYLRLSAQVEVVRSRESGVQQGVKPWSREGLRENSVIIKLSALIGFDTFGSGMLTQSIFTLWLVLRFGAGAGTIAVLLFISELLQTVSLPIAAKIANRIGLLNTMVGTQVPNNILSIVIAILPSFPAVFALYVIRSLVSGMDGPSRQAYTVMVVPPEKRTAASGANNISRGVSRSFSSGAAGYLIQHVDLAAPFFTSGGVKLVYDLLLYLGFRHRKES